MSSTSSNVLSSTNYLGRLIRHPVCSKVVHFVLESGCSHWSSCFEYSELLLVENLGICKTLIWNLAQVGGSHHLLRHHQVVCLRPVDSFLALDGSYTILRVRYCLVWNVADRSNASDASRHILLTKLLD